MVGCRSRGRRHRQDVCLTRSPWRQCQQRVIYPWPLIYVVRDEGEFLPLSGRVSSRPLETDASDLIVSIYLAGSRGEHRGQGAFGQVRSA